MSVFPSVDAVEEFGAKESLRCLDKQGCARRLVLAQPGGHKDPTYLADLIRVEGVTVCHFVPSMLQVFLQEPGLERS